MSIKIFCFASELIHKIMEQDNLPLGAVVGGMMREMYRVLKKRDSEQSETPLTIQQHAVLYILNNKKSDVILKEIASTMGKDKSSILRIIDSLEEKELVRRAIDQKDRRKKYLMVTKKGEKVIEHFSKIENELKIELKQGLSPEEINAFYKVVNHLRTKAEPL